MNANTDTLANIDDATLMLRESFALHRGKTLPDDVLNASRQRLSARQRWQPRPPGDDEPLPIDARREEIIDALTANQVIVVSGETGSGKTTQLPRYALQAGFGRRGMIGHTQPRRLAARSVAARIAEQTGCRLGDGVGFAVRFDDQSSETTLVRLMTDGILLNELQHDRLLLNYELIIIDEAHERSLNIDFLLGLLATVLPKRPDLKVIITSATIDHQRFAEHFGGAPVIEVSGRGYPVTVRYSDVPALGEDSRAIARQVCEAVRAIKDEKLPEHARDILVFLPGEREIRDAERALHKSGLVPPSAWSVLPLFGRLSDQQQSAVFASCKTRRVVLATNVAETSLTVPRIGAVIDSGLARISRYSPRSRVQRLKLEPVSQASADQRAGRCGRIGPGLCIRLYPEDDFEQRPAFTDAEILRTNLASVVLQMAALGLGEVEAFPFLDQPDAGQIDDAHRLLHELGALNDRGRISKLGRRLSRLPLDPRLGRMLLEPADMAISPAVLVVVAGLSIQDPRQRPLEQAHLADKAHAAYVDMTSDFVTLLNLWARAQTARQTSSRRDFERWCEGQFLSPRRMREWREVATQLARQLKVDIRKTHERALTEPEQIKLHQHIVVGLLSQVGHRDESIHYTGSDRKRFQLHPASGLMSKPAPWIMALEIVQTHKRFARYVAAIDSDWVIRAARHLLDYEYEAPYWNARRGRVEARRTTLLFGLVLSANQRIDFAEVNREQARQVFIRQGLVADKVRVRAAFIAHNRQQLAEIALLAGRLRRAVEISDEAFAALYETHLPAHVVDNATLKRWLSGRDAKRESALCFSQEQLLSEPVDALSSGTPTEAVLQGNRLTVDYAFAPQQAEDGATLQVPVALLPALRRADVDESVPAFLEHRIEARLRKLAKAQRKQLQPLAKTAVQLATTLIGEPDRGELDARLQRVLVREYAMSVDRAVWQDLVEPLHWQPRIAVMDDSGRELAASRSLASLHEQLGAKIEVAPRPEKTVSSIVSKRWQFGEIPRQRQVTRQAVRLEVFPALRRTDGGVTVHEFLDEKAALIAHHEAVAELLQLKFSQQMKALRKQLLMHRGVQLLWAAFDDHGATVLIEDYLHACVLHAFGEDLATVRDQAAFESLAIAQADQLLPNGERLLEALECVLQRHAECRTALDDMPDLVGEASTDMHQQIDALVYPGFVSATPVQRFGDLQRYLSAVLMRVERVRSNPDRDRQSLAMIASLSARVDALKTATAGARQEAAVRAFRWQIEELRVSLFAQTLGTREKVSAKRLEKRWDEILRMQG